MNTKPPYLGYLSQLSIFPFPFFIHPGPIVSLYVQCAYQCAIMKSRAFCYLVVEIQTILDGQTPALGYSI